MVVEYIAVEISIVLGVRLVSTHGATEWILLSTILQTHYIEMAQLFKLQFELNRNLMTLNLLFLSLQFQIFQLHIMIKVENSNKRLKLKQSGQLKLVITSFLMICEATVYNTNAKTTTLVWPCSCSCLKEDSMEIETDKFGIPYFFIIDRQPIPNRPTLSGIITN